MVKVSVGGYELEFAKEHVEKFERIVCDSFKESAELYLLTDFEEMSIDEIFSNHTEKEIIDVIMDASTDEIRLFNGEI